MNLSGGIGGSLPQGESPEALLRSGAAREKTIFIIICVAAIGVAAVAIGSFLLGGSGPGPAPGWQCLKCSHEFSYIGPELPPIDCPKGHKAQAVRLSYRICPKCHKRALLSRVRLPEPWAGEYRRQTEQGNPPSAMVTAEWPREIQYRLRQDDRSYRWSDWLVMRSPEATQIESSLKCSKCSTALYPQRRRKNSNGT